MFQLKDGKGETRRNYDREWWVQKIWEGGSYGVLNRIPISAIIRTDRDNREDPNLRA